MTINVNQVYDFESRWNHEEYLAHIVFHLIPYIYVITTFVYKTLIVYKSVKAINGFWNIPYPV